MPNMIKNLVFEGGGAKGIAYGGAIVALEQKGELQTVVNVAGASAGAIAAMIVGLGCNAAEIQELLEYDFNQFKDGSSNKFANAINVYQTWGIHPGNELHKWLSDVIAKKLGNSKASFADLHAKVLAQRSTNAFRYRDIFCIGANLSRASADIFSYYTTPNMPIADAIRISASIPIFFSPKRYKHDSADSTQGDLYVDGGVINNCPIRLFDADHPNPETLVLRLGSSDEINELRDEKRMPTHPVETILDFGMSLVNTVTKAQSAFQAFDNFRTIFIDVGNVGTTQFHLSTEEKETLRKSSQKAVDAFFSRKESWAYLKQKGSMLMQEKHRLEKYDRYHLYNSATQLYYSDPMQTMGVIHCVFAVPNQFEWQAVKNKVARYYERIAKQPLVDNIQHRMLGDNTHQQIISLTVPQPFLIEIQKWIHKHSAEAKVITHLPIVEDKLIILQQRMGVRRPAWMIKEETYDKAIFDLVNSHALKEISEWLAQGHSVKMHDLRHNSLLHEAARSISGELVKLLLDHSADPNSQNHYGDRPLHKATDALSTDPEEALKMIRLLLARGAQVDVKNKYGITPLMIAVKLGHIEAVKLFLNYGADPLCEDNDHHTALSKATHYQKEDILQVLKAYLQPRHSLSVNPVAYDEKVNAQQSKAEVAASPLNYSENVNANATPLPRLGFHKH